MSTGHEPDDGGMERPRLGGIVAQHRSSQRRSLGSRIGRALLVVVFVVLLLGGGLAAYVASFLHGVLPLPTAEAVLPSGAVLVNDGGAAFIVPVSEGHAFVIDCTNDKSAVALKAALKARALKVDAILLTHAHPDHVHGCAALDAPVVALEAEVPAIEGRAMTHGPIPRLFGLQDYGVRVATAAHDGQVLRYGPKSVRVFAVPGHTAGSAAYLVDGTLYLGDTATAHRDGASIDPPFWIVTDDQAQGVDSLHKLAARLVPEDVTTFAFAHSGWIKADLAMLAAVHR